MHASLSHLLTCAEEIYTLRLYHDFRDDSDAALASTINRLRGGPRGDSPQEVDWSTVSGSEWKYEMEELKGGAECWIFILEEFSQRVEERK